MLRTLNIYGDPVPWSEQRNGLYTFFSFINVFKYPPSLLYMCVTIGPALIFLAAIENVRNGFTSVVKIYGRVALFYYVIHIYLVHILSMIAYFLRGHSLQEAYNPNSHFPFFFLIRGEGTELWTVYIIWIGVVVALYPLCKKYNAYKSAHRQWWLSYV